jgi:hypothetical protein
MESHPGQPLDVPALGVITGVPHGYEALGEVEGNYELELPRLVPDHPDRIHGNIVAGCCSNEPDQSSLVRMAKRDVLRVIWVLAPVLVSEQAVRFSASIVGRRLTGRGEARSNG